MGAVVAAAAVVDVVLLLVVVVPGVLVVVLVPDVLDGAVVVVVAAGATNGTVSLWELARVRVGDVVRSVQSRAAFQLWSAVAAAVPVSGWGTPEAMVAGCHAALSMWRP